MKKNFIIIICAAVCIISIAVCGVVLTNKLSQSGTQGTQQGIQSITENPYTGNTGVTADTASMDFALSDRDTKTEYTEAAATEIIFGTEISVNGNFASVEGSTVTLTGESTFIVSGNATDAQLKVEAADTDKLQIVFKSLSLSNTQGPAVYIKCADKVFITLEGESTISGGSDTVDEETSLDGALFSKEDLTINGSGTLNVEGVYKHGIVSKDDLVLTGCTVNVNAKNVCLSGKDCVKLSGGTYNLTAGSDGIRADNTEDSTRGFVYIDAGTVNIIAENDGIQAETALNITGGTFNISSGGGSANASTTASGQWNDMWGFGGMAGGASAATDEESGKALKSSSALMISGGSFNIDSADDAIHSNGSIIISDGEITAKSGDDGIHADDTLYISSGNINITKSYEGLEASKIDIIGGTIDLVASDDGFNAAGGNDSSALGGRPGQNNFMAQTDAYINISGGYIHLNASGDGIDSNGSFILSGGTVLVSGPTNSGNGAFDYGSAATVTGGILIATGSNGMATGFTDAQSQGAILTSLTTQGAGSSIAICDKNGVVLASFTPDKAYQSAVITAPGILKNETYTVVCGGTVTNADKNGFGQSTSVSGGTTVATIQMSSLIYGSSGGMGGGGMSGFGGGMGGRR